MNYFFTVAIFFISAHSFSQSKSDTVELADPTIFQYENKFYLYGTGSRDGFLVYVSNDLKSWKLSDTSRGYALKKGDAFGRSGFWAPQVFSHRNKFYMAYTANEQIAIAAGESPLGPFKQTQKDSLASTTKQIDPFIFIDDDGKKYLYHVRLTNGNRIFVAELNDDFSSIRSYTLRECINASDPWENTNNASWPVSEGPTVVKRNNVYYMFYSANDFRNPDYAVGYATSDNPLGPWKKSRSNPVIVRKILNINGTGHGDLFNQDNVWYYVFHTHPSNRKPGPRKTAIITLLPPKKHSREWKILPESFRYIIESPDR